MSDQAYVRHAGAGNAPVFVQHESLGWVCHCGASEKLPALTTSLETVTHPVVSHFYWNGPERTTVVQCGVCGCEASKKTTYKLIDMQVDTVGVARTKNG